MRNFWIIIKNRNYSVASHLLNKDYYTSFDRTQKANKLPNFGKVMMAYLTYCSPIAARGESPTAKTSAAEAKKLERNLRRYQKDLLRQKIKFNFPIYYLWFHYLKLALELEKKNYWIPKRGAKGVENVAAGVAIVVQREKYQGWDLEVLLDSKFYLWRNKERIRHLAQHHPYNGKPQYDALAKRFNVYVRYLNERSEQGDKFDRGDFAYHILMKWEKVRYDRVNRSTNQSKTDWNRIVWKDVKAAEEVLLRVCSGEFP